MQRQVVFRVPRNDVQQRAHAELATRCRAGARGGVGGQASDHRDGRRSHHQPLAQHVVVRPPGEPGAAHPVVLLHAGQFVLVTARHVRGAIREDALGVGHVPDHFGHAPLAGLVRELALRGRQRAERLHHLLSLASQHVHEVPGRRARDVAAVVLEVLIRVGRIDARAWRSRGALQDGEHGVGDAGVHGWLRVKGSCGVRTH